MLFVLGLDIEEKDSKLVTPDDIKKLLQNKRSLIFSVKELTPEDIDLEPSSLGYVSFDKHLCDCSDASIGEEGYYEYSHKIFYVWSPYDCNRFERYGCKLLESSEIFANYYSYNKHQFYLEKETLTYEELLKNSAYLTEECPDGRKKCGIIDKFYNYYCSKDGRCPITKFTFGGTTYGDGSNVIINIGINAPATGKNEIDYLLYGGWTIQKKDEPILTKYQLLEENDIIEKLNRTYLDENLRGKYNLSDFSLNHTDTKLGYQVGKSLSNGMRKYCYESIVQIDAVTNDFNDMIYSGLNGLSFGLAVAWIGLGFYLYPAACTTIDTNPIATLVLFSILGALTFTQLITNIIFCIKIFDSKYDFIDVCSIYDEKVVDKLSNNRIIVKLNMFFIALNMIFGALNIFCLANIVKIKKHKNDEKSDKIDDMKNLNLLTPSNSFDKGSSQPNTNNVYNSPYQSNGYNPNANVSPYISPVPSNIYTSSNVAVNVPNPVPPQGGAAPPVPSGAPNNYLTGGFYYPPTSQDIPQKPM